MAPTLVFDRSARYGAAIVAMLVGGYLGIATDFSSIVQSEVYAGTIASDAPLLSAVQFLLVLGSMLAGVVLLPTSGWRRLGAFTLVCVVLLLLIHVSQNGLSFPPDMTYAAPTINTASTIQNE